MIFPFRVINWQASLNRVRGMFNLNDSRWGRGPDDENKPNGEPHQSPNQQNPRNKGDENQPDLDEVLRELQNRIGAMFGKAPRGPSNPNSSGGGSGPNPSRFSVGLVVGVVTVIWLMTGFFIVDEQKGQQAVITQFGKYHSTVKAGINYRLPYPIQQHVVVNVTQIRNLDVGSDKIIKATGLRESAMLTQDENIVEVKFAVQYRLSDARAFLFESTDPEGAIRQAAETAIREVLGGMKLDAALSEEREQVAPKVRALMQKILDRYKVGVEVVAINLQQGGVRPPEQVQAAFDDVLKAGQEGERIKNEAQAYANDVIPRAVGAASRLKEEADAYKARIVAQAEGDSQRFQSVLTEYQKAPQVTRDRLYLDAMQQVYNNVTKVVVDSKQGSNLLYLPLDKIIQSVNTGSPEVTVNGATNAANAAHNSSATVTTPATNNTNNTDRSRDTSRSRDRDVRQ